MTASHAAGLSVRGQRLGYAGLLPSVLLGMVTWLPDAGRGAFACAACLQAFESIFNPERKCV